MTVSALDLFFYAGALLILYLTPGPVWVALTARALSGGFPAAWPLAVGVVLGDIIWPLTAILGLAWLLALYSDLLELLRWVAAIIFVVMGIELIRRAHRTLSIESRLLRPGIWAGFLAGLVVILANPKAILFYMGVLPGFFNLADIQTADVVAIVAISGAIPLAGNLIIAVLIDRVRSLLQSPATVARIHRISGALLILVGVLIVIPA
jgi:threonine/homoserine/homoserine lactone efflux protein